MKATFGQVPLELSLADGRTALRWGEPGEGRDAMAELLTGLSPDGLLRVAGAVGAGSVCELQPPEHAERWVLDPKIPKAPDRWRAWRPGDPAVAYGAHAELAAAVEALLQRHLVGFDGAEAVPTTVDLARQCHVVLLSQLDVRVTPAE